MNHHTQYIFNSEIYCMIQYFKQIMCRSSKFYIAIPEIYVSRFKHKVGSDFKKK